MMIGPAGLALIKEFEGCEKRLSDGSLKAYQDGGGVWTIGFGHTGPDVIPGLIWTQAQADAALMEDIKEAEEGVNRLVKVPLTQNEFDALVSFAFNVGLDIDADTQAEGLGDSTLLRKLNEHDYNGASAEFQKWCKDNGKIVPGLKRRRLAEAILFEKIA
jgi:lysozyme